MVTLPYRCCWNWKSLLKFCISDYAIAGNDAALNGSINGIEVNLLDFSVDLLAQVSVDHCPVRFELLGTMFCVGMAICPPSKVVTALTTYTHIGYLLLWWFGRYMLPQSSRGPHKYLSLWSAVSNWNVHLRISMVFIIAHPVTRPGHVALSHCSALLSYQFCGSFHLISPQAFDFLFDLLWEFTHFMVKIESWFNSIGVWTCFALYPSTSFHIFGLCMVCSCCLYLSALAARYLGGVIIFQMLDVYVDCVAVMVSPCCLGVISQMRNSVLIT